MASPTTQVRVNTRIKKMVNKHVKSTKQTVGGFYDLAAQKMMFDDWCENQSPESIFEWGATSIKPNAPIETIRKQFSEMTNGQKLTAFSLNLKPL